MFNTVAPCYSVVVPNNRCASLCQTVAVHQEKVARREIGLFSIPKKIARTKCMTLPKLDIEPQRRYAREPISFNTLDCIGHSFQVKLSKFIPFIFLRN